MFYFWKLRRRLLAYQSKDARTSSSSSRSLTRPVQQWWWSWWSSSGPPTPHIISVVCQLVYWCEVWCAVCCVLVTSRFQTPSLDSPAMGEKEAECIHLSSLPVHSLSVDNPYVEPPSWWCTVTEHFTTSGWSTWVSEEVCP